jgi:3-hydroxyacyl-[acyl-carrier-protein] dehydratase
VSDSPHSFALRVPADHPSLPGHFLGNPVVPGVVLLDEVVARVQAVVGDRVLQRIPQVKFLAPLLPEQDARIEIAFDDDTNRAKFRVLREALVLASGDLVFAAS